MIFLELLEMKAEDIKDLAQEEGVDQYYNKRKRDLIEELVDLGKQERALLFADDGTDLTWSEAIYKIAKEMDISGRGGKSTPDLIEAILDKGLDSLKNDSQENASKNNSSESTTEGDIEDRGEVIPSDMEKEEQEVRRTELQRALQSASRTAAQKSQSMAIFESFKASDPQNMFQVKPAYIGWEEEGYVPVAMIYFSCFAFPPGHA